MGMTNKQFDAYNKKLLDRINRVIKLLQSADKEEAEKELQKILDDLQKSIDD